MFVFSLHPALHSEATRGFDWIPQSVPTCPVRTFEASLVAAEHDFPGLTPFDVVAAFCRESV